MTITRVSTALSQTVYEAALDRIRFVYDNCDDVIVSMSGGKDSTVLLHLTKLVAAERGRLPVKVQWLDAEAEWQATADFMRQVFYSPDVKAYWYQFPVRLAHSLSASDEFLHCWNPAERQLWIREQDPIAITSARLACGDLYEEVIKWMATLADTADKQHAAVLVGMRAAESTQRRIQIGFSGSGDKRGERRTNFKGITWSSKPRANTRVFWPIYDWQDQDVWVCIARNDLAYNRIYDFFYRYGIVGRGMRVSSLIHEGGWQSVQMLQEMEPETYDRFLKRVHGTSAFAHFERREIMPRTLPAAFKDWREYRDYLLEHLIEPRYREQFRKRFARPSLNTPDVNGSRDRWYQIHVREIMINDFDGILSDKARANFKLVDRNQTGFYARRQASERAARSQPQPDQQSALGADREGLR